MKSAIAAIIIALSMLTSLGADDAPPHDAERLFSDKVQPLLTSRCVNCHGAAKVEGGLRLDSRKAAIEGGDSGPSLVPGKPSETMCGAA